MKNNKSSETSVLPKIKNGLTYLNKHGIPLPMIKDPKTGLGSVSLTLVFLSSIYVQLALLNMFAQMFKGVDIVNALYWHGMTLALYFGRGFSSRSPDGNESSIGRKLD
jgi:hypothetical protein